VKITSNPVVENINGEKAPFLLSHLEERSQRKESL
jgi:hypothetical protein